MLKVAIFDDVVAVRGETFHIPGLEVHVHAHADEAALLCAQEGYDMVFMDYAMGEEHQHGDEAVRALRASGFRGHIVGISSDPTANAAMKNAGADDCLAQKAHLRSFLVRVSSEHLAESSAEQPGRGSDGASGGHGAGQT